MFDGPQRSLVEGDVSQVEVDDDFHAITATSPLATPPQLPVDIVDYHQLGGGDSSLSHVRELSTPQSIASTATTVIAAGQSATDSDPTTTWTSNDHMDDLSYAEVTPRQLIDERSWQQRSMNRQSALLRFRYQVVPWIESNNCKSMFGPAIMTLACDSKIVSDCISACVQMRDQSLVSGNTTPAGLAVPSRLLDQLARDNSFPANVGHALLTISSVFCAPPSEWASIVSTCTARLTESVLSGGEFELTLEPLKSLLRLQLKVGKRRRTSGYFWIILKRVAFRSCSIHRDEQASLGQSCDSLSRSDDQ